jgi:Pyruvate/2-oxoacid:ferredoxin oxidoreductase delta subunit
MPQTIYDQMTEKIMLTGSKIIPEIFKMLTDEDGAALLMAMPGTPEQLSKKTEKPLEAVEVMCRDLYRKGAAFKSFKGGETAYKMARDPIQFHDGTILWPEAPQKFLDLWQTFMEEEWPDFARLAAQFFPRAVTRVIPVGKSIDSGKHQILDADSVDKIIESADALAVTRCTCRVIAHKCDKPVEVCLQVNNAARYTLDRGTGREISKSEALDILRRCEEEGLVHVTMNKAHVGHFICNCCECCCQAMPLVISEGLSICDPSRYRAEIDPAACQLCGTCQDRCMFNAIVESRTETGEASMEVDPDKCMGCGVCHTSCPEGAVSLVEARGGDFIPI